MKLIMAIFVMIVHFSPFKTIDPLLHFLSIHGFTRISVPFFILSTGYLISEDGKIGDSRRNKSLKKLVSLYVFWTLIYLPLIIAQVVYSPHNSQWWVSFLRNIFFEGSFIHLWYLLATIIGLIIITLLSKRLSSPWIILITITLFVLGVLGDSYYGFSMTVPFLRSFKSTLFQFIQTTRNGLFFAPIFLYTGMLIKKYQPHYKIRTLSIAFMVLLFISITEVLLLRNAGWARDYNLTFSILPLSAITFILSLHINVPFNTDKYKEIATTLFYIHIGVYVVVQFILTAGDITQFRNYGFLAFGITVFVSFILTFIIHRFKHHSIIKDYFM